MKHINLFLIVITAASLTACASRQAATTDSANTSKSAPAKESAKKEAAPEGAIVGKPAKGSKFAKLKIGMTLPQVEKLIGPPTKQWQHPTGKNAIPFYFGPDRWVIQYSYKGEGILTLNSGGDQLLTRIEVNKAE
ncbi:MAG: hypothetical protein Q7U94_02700 [Sideroxyarcus sp.]|nr:hypothetical protein [Sideroxyarcus sp.]